MLEALAIAAVIHVVQPGETLWSIAPGHNWGPVCRENNLSNCNLIYPGQKLRVGGQTLTVRLSDPRGDGDNDSDDTGHSDPVRHSQSHSGSVAVGSVGYGTLGCTGLERLWIAAGGSPGAAFVAAEIAMAESGGRQYATGPAGERGYWQIHPDHGSLSTYDPFGNARAAVIISGNGSNWGAWTTYTSGAYVGRCL
jgi:Lysozyme like domain/LysM domain